MNYITVVAWGLCPGGTSKQVANYFSSWGLIGDSPSPAIQLYYRIPTIPMIPSMPTMGNLFILVGLLIGSWI
jgi:hypothetical protein